jgi:hypothetical protein
VIEQAPEPAPPAPATEKQQKDVQPATATERPAESTTSGSVAEKGPPEPPPAAAPPTQVLSALIDSLTAVSTAAEPARTSASESSGAIAVGGLAGVAGAQRPGNLSCELAALEGRMPDSCTGGWFGAQRFRSASPVGVSVAAISVAPGKDVPPGGGHGGSGVGSPPVSPAPAPAPSGASGGSAAGASGLGLSGFLTLASLLLLGAPRAMRRLRLSCQPWLTACFALIPERPG